MTGSDIHDVIIIGSGPAGLTAGIYTSRAGLRTLLFAGEKWGGQLQLTTEVENFPGFPEGIMGPQLMENMRKQAERFGVEMRNEDVKEVTVNKQPFEINGTLSRSVIVATGAEFKWLGIPSEQKLIGRGVSACATCDAAFFKNKKVVVVGGGDAAMEEALVVAKFASETLIVHRRDMFRASKIMQDRVMNNPKIKTRLNDEVVEILGENKVEGVVLKSGEKILTDGVFVAIGHRPASDVFARALLLDERGFIVKQEGMMTSVPGVFVAGDVHDLHYRQAITAAGFGCQAALEVEKWLINQK
jgi:thioredoxin reductase (NADPH)